MKKKILSFFITVILILGLVPFSALAYEGFEGNGTSDDPYLIKTAEEFVYLLNNPDTDAYYKLANDIDMTGQNWTVKQCYMPAGIADSYLDVSGDSFRGVLDGNGKTIRNINKSVVPEQGEDNLDLLGLFGTIGETGIVKELNIEDSYLKGTNSVGFIAGLNLGTITNCSIVNSELDSDEIVHKTAASGDEDFTNFSVGTSGAGGIAGFNQGEILSCKVNGLKNTRGGANLGGIAGTSHGMIKNCESRNIKAINIITRLTDYKGSFTLGSIGGIAGSIQRFSYEWDPAVIDNCVNYSDIDYTQSGGGICGWNCDGIIKNCVNYGNIKIATNVAQEGFENGIWAGGISGDMWQFIAENDTQIINCANYGDVEGRHDVGGIIGRADFYGGGSFGAIDPGPILPGEPELITEVDESNKLLVANCLNQGNVTGLDRVAGIIGKSDGLVTTCFNTGKITAKGEYEEDDDYYVAGIVAVSNNGIEYCGNSGEVSSVITTINYTSPKAIGGVVGIADKSPIKKCYNIAPVRCAIEKDRWEAEYVFIGGIAGSVVNASIEDVYFANDVGSDATLSYALGPGTADEGLSAAKMRGMQAKKTMPGLFGEDSPFEASDNFEIAGVFYTTSPFIPAAFMDKTTIAVVDHVVPATDDSNLYILWISLMILSMLAIALTSRKLIIKKLK